MLYKIGCVLLDFDGTLADTIELHVKSFEKALEKYNINVNPREIIDKIGMTAREILEKLSELHPEIKKVNIEDIIKEKKKEYLKDFDKYVKLHPGSIELLEFLKKNKKCIGLVTSSDRSLINKFFEKFSDIKEYFDFIITSDDVKEGKPHPEPYLKAIEKARIDKRNIVAIEDSAYGVVSAKNAGINVFGVLTGVGDKKTLKSLGAIKVFKNLIEIKDFLEKHNFEINLNNLVK